MPNLSECCNQIGELVSEKKFHADLLFFKLVWGQVELAEAIDLVKKNGLPDPEEHGQMKCIDELAEEIVDVVFYMCDAYRLLRRRYGWLLNMDEMFEYKMQKNMSRPTQYGNKWITSFLQSAVDHFHKEGILDEMVMEFLQYAGKKKGQEFLKRTITADERMYILPPRDCFDTD